MQSALCEASVGLPSSTNLPEKMKITIIWKQCVADKKLQDKYLLGQLRSTEKNSTKAERKMHLETK